MERNYSSLSSEYQHPDLGVAAFGRWTLGQRTWFVGEMSTPRSRVRVPMDWTPGVEVRTGRSVPPVMSTSRTAPSPP